ncbi:MAG: aldo/keto reductase [Acidobacteriaceae bacterium]|jgi:aryl-alcohol dehydrogenase-like predicted oxidoreductase
MRQSVCGEIRMSVLGFGCGSVLGRVGRRASLRAMNAAWDQGITLFDTARSYGYGEAEAVLGEFLRGKREQAMVATKFGIAPQRQTLLRRMAVPLARAALHVNMPRVRNLVHRGSAREALSGQFTVAGLRASLESSLRQLRTDHVDILFLHEASADSMRQQDLMTELDALVLAGKVRRVGLYAGAAVIAECMADGPPTLSAMQFGANPFDPTVAGFTQPNRRELLLIANHPFGGEQRVARLQMTLAAMSADERLPIELRDKLRGAGWQVLIEAIFALVLNGTGTHALVFSMMREDHLRANVRAVESSRFTDADLAMMRERLLNSPAGGSGT